eukprot:CAMPEP_0172471504 /NCGR_PEP_ID=MMETSP1065-20121228/67853_1 /TAXON_ID=265537 /ORGANISM="Amphiprora paludosa, Strain CCMP125" /LENGTH=831 /DNA_ID=CAMNT_0013229607 /DNA_START=211 /DNA_END=2706 /DNA_ORIENTATION=-
MAHTRSKVDSTPSRRFPASGRAPLQQKTLSSTVLSAKLWDRLQVEEDPEPYWYLINCVAGLEMDLLKQCREACEDIPDAIKFVVPTDKRTRSHGANRMVTETKVTDAIKFVVPTKKETRSHGANRMVTETKVKYMGYVFAKLRLCPEVYETIQQLDLCRSWMGTVNHKGHKKLPPAPISLNEVEVENFGLDEYEDEDDESEFESEEDEAQGVILDSAENEEKGPQVDQEAIKAFLGIKVDDMVKVTAKGKFFNEDGIVRRLKDGKLFIRFYTYGTMFEEWLGPSDVRKLTNMEILKGLSGPSEPVTQQDFDQRQEGGGRSHNARSYNDRPRNDGDLRQSLAGNAGGPRNRRQDRTERNFQQKRDFFGRTNDERQREERNWNWYQDQQRAKRRNDATDGESGMIAGSRRGSQSRESDWAVGNVDSQWGRGGRNTAGPGARQNNRYQPGGRNNNNENGYRNNSNNRQANRQANAAIEGDNDWSAFVSSSQGNKRRDNIGNSNAEEDDFFSSLMNDISPGNKRTQNAGRGGDASSGSTSSTSDDDDFFDSLLSDLKEESSAPKRERKQPPRENQRYNNQKHAGPPVTSSADDDFFSSLESELGSALDATSTKGKEVGQDSSSDMSDDFFAQLEAELAVPDSKPKKTSHSSSSTSSESEDLFAALEIEMDSSASASKSKKPDLAPTAADDDFFASLESELDNAASSPMPKTEKQQPVASSSMDNDDFFASLASDLGDLSSESGGDDFLAGLEPETKTSANDDGISFWNDEADSGKPKQSNKQVSAPKSSTATVSTSSPSSSDLQKQTVPALKEMLRERGLKVSGKKAELIERLSQ